MADGETSDLPNGPEQVGPDTHADPAILRSSDVIPNGDSRRDRSGTGWLLGALAVWAIVIAAGAYLYGYRADARKPIIVAATMGTFLIAWALMLRRRSHSEDQSSAKRSTEKRSTAARSTKAEH